MKIQALKRTFYRLLYVFRLMWNLRFWNANVCLVLIIIISSIPALQIWINKHSIDAISRLGAISSEELFRAIILVSISNLSVFIVTFLREIEKLNFAIIKEDVDLTIKKRILNKATKVPLHLFDDPNFHDTIQLTQVAANRSGVDIIKQVFAFFGSFISIASMIGVLFLSHWSLPIALVMTSLPGIIFLFLAKRSRYKLAVETTSISRESAYVYRLLTHRNFAKEIRLFQLNDYLKQRWGSLFSIIRKKNINQIVKEGKANVLGVFILTLFSSIVAIITVIQISNENLTIGDYVALTGAVLSMQASVSSIGSSIGQVYESSLFLNNLFDFLELPQENKEKVNEKDDGFPTYFSEIRISDLSFSYAGSEQKILDGVTFSIRRGEKIVIVGENGAGKSTLAHCLLGLYKPTSGKIWIDNVDLNSLSEYTLSKKITAIFQDFVKYQYSFRENVGFGNVQKMDNDELILENLDKVDLLDAVNSSNLDTILGREFLGGKELSGGQWQRIALARSLFREAEVLIWDEPTASLDPLAEQKILSTLFEQTAGKTCIIISHRLMVGELCDKIIVLKNGKVVEMGDHEQLVVSGGEYSNMYATYRNHYAKASELI